MSHTDVKPIRFTGCSRYEPDVPGNGPMSLMIVGSVLHVARDSAIWALEDNLHWTKVPPLEFMDRVRHYSLH